MGYMLSSMAITNNPFTQRAKVIPANPIYDIALIACLTEEELFNGSSVRRSIKMKKDPQWYDKPSTVDDYLNRIDSLILHMRGDKDYWSYNTPEHYYRWN